MKEYLLLLKEYEGRKVNVENEFRDRKKLGLELLGVMLHYLRTEQVKIG